MLNKLERHLYNITDRRCRQSVKVSRDYRVRAEWPAKLDVISNNHRWIITCFTTVSLVTSNIRGSSICSPKSLYKKTTPEILEEVKADFKTGASKVPRPRPVLPSLLWPICQACVNSQLSPTPPSPPRGREKKNVTKMNLSSWNDHSPKWIINYCYIFFPYLRVWVFLFLWASFFKAQHLGPMSHL